MKKRAILTTLVAVGLCASAVVAVGMSGGEQADAQPQRCLGRDVTIVAEPGKATVGTNGPDVIMGTNGPDVIRSRGGNDRVCSRGGSDTIRTGAGHDRVAAGGGPDLVIAGGGQDRVQGNGGNDTLRGNKGNDFLNGGKGVDDCAGGAGSDTLRSCNETPNPGPTPTPTPVGGCHPSYPTVCIPPPPPDLNCGDIVHRRFKVQGSDPHNFDTDGDGIGCES